MIGTRKAAAPFDWLGAFARRHPVAWLVALCALALQTRLVNYALRPLWFDEAEQYAISAAPTIPDVVCRLNALDRNPPGFSLVLHGFIRVLGHEEWVLRLPSLLGGLGSVVLAGAVGRRWLGREAGLALAILAALLPTWAFYAREARPYATGILCVLALMHAVAVRVERPGRLATLYVLAAATVTVLWQYASVFVVVAALCAGRAWERRWPDRTRASRQTWTLALGLVVAIALASFLLFQWPQIQANGIKSEFLRPYFFRLDRPREAIAFLATRPAEYLEYLATARRMSWPWRLVCLLNWAPIVAGLIWGARLRGRGRAVLWLALAPALGLVATAALQLHPFGPVRHCLPLAPGILLAHVAGWAWLRRHGWRWPADAMMIGLLVFAVIGQKRTVDWHRHDLKDVLETARDQFEEDDGLVFLVMAGSVYRYYEPEVGLSTWPPVYCDAVKLAKAKLGPEFEGLRDGDFSALIDRTLSGRRRLWLVGVQEDAAAAEAILAKQAHKASQIDGFRVHASLWIREETPTASPFDLARSGPAERK
jgi:hypothetical protein